MSNRHHENASKQQLGQAGARLPRPRELLRLPGFTMAQVLVYLVSLYALAGAVFAVGFVSVGILRVDRSAEGSPVPFRLCVFPGAVALWPLLAARWVQAVRRGGGS